MLNISEMIEKWGGTIKDCQEFEDIMNKALCLDRNCLLLDIVEGTGDFVHNVIYYWNKIDDANNVPIDKREPIKLYIDSNGGDLIQTFILIDSIRLSKTPVWTIGMGAVYSGGFFTFIAGHKRIAYPSSSFLYHEGATGTFGDAGKFRNYACFYEKQLNTLKNYTLKYWNKQLHINTGLTSSGFDTSKLWRIYSITDIRPVNNNHKGTVLVVYPFNI